jgi:hypothetical protein
MAVGKLEAAGFKDVSFAGDRVYGVWTGATLEADLPNQLSDVKRYWGPG